ncbi:uncharacterized protein LOC126332396 [Schistocerca gregaria]|uniref:uncharacterized protein LOC126332396 n=1 Tax=Schistocerca gregaria TaxID=7010 RepID=UPI00211F1E7E|nr:uncharacterized protein LOC126332396 [Schistocerca gregaria]
MAIKDEVDINDLAAYDSEDDVIDEPEKEIGKKEHHGTVSAVSFRDFLLKPELLRAIGECGFETPSEVQQECIPRAITGTDVICQAKSGMGKTAVFVLSVLQRINPVEKQVACIILCHTRELAHQIKNEFDRFKKYLPSVKTAVFFGGTPISTHRNQLKTEVPHIVVGTPGRTLQLVQEGDLNLKHTQCFILDECDRMLEDVRMRRDVQEIFKITPHDKQVMMFSATLSENLRPICKKFMHDPLEIYINDGSKLTLDGLQQYYVQLEENQKNSKLADILDQLEFNQVVIFVKSIPRASALGLVLNKVNFPAIVVHSRMEQPERIERYRKFKAFDSRILVSTDLFGRGVDFERVNVVVNYDMPIDADTYLHRVARAGRFGTKGVAISFVASEDDAKVINSVQNKLYVNIPAMPKQINPSTYMTA